MDDIVSTQWLDTQLGAADLCIVDATRHHFEPHRNSAEEYLQGHIPGAVFLDLLHLVDADAPVDNTMPTPEQFQQRMRDLGIDRGQRIVIYDDSVVKTAARAWFMFRVFGLTDVAVLDGGIAKWRAERRAVEAGPVERAGSAFVATFDRAMLRSKEQVLANIASRSELHLDGRGAQHFSGESADPNPLLAAGHVPGSINVPFWDLFNDDGAFKSPDELRLLFESKGVDPSAPAFASCGGGVVACSLALALRLLGNDRVALYDGSWTEWGADPALPKASGAA